MGFKKRVRFPGAVGAELAGRLELPHLEPRGMALLAHCFSCSKDAKALVRIARALVEEGFAVFRFDFTGVGDSGGEFADTNFTTNVEDLVAAADYLRQEIRAPEVLVGHSLGGAAVLAGAKRIPEARAVATLAAPSDTRHLEHTLLHSAPELAEAGEAELNLLGRPVRLRKQLLEDLAEVDLESAIAGLDLPLLILHSPQDQIVPVDHARRIYKAARHPKSFVALDGADHLLLDEKDDAQFVGRLLATWAGRYLEPVDVEDRDLDGGEVLVESRSSGFFNRISAGMHTLVADEPRSLGGTDAGPNPYDLLLASLGACKSMTLRMYAERKQWPLEEVSVRLRHQRIHAKDCEECQSTDGKIDQIEVDLDLSGPLTEEQLERLAEISERCPVQRTLVTETVVKSDRQTGEGGEG